MNDPTISKHLIETKGYSDLEVPVILTSGEYLTPFFVNTEKLCRDPDINTFLNSNANNPDAIIDHVIGQMKKHDEFNKDCQIIAEYVSELMKEYNNPAISGGMRRDLVFSGPVSYLLHLPHISLFKQETGQKITEDMLEVTSPDGSLDESGAIYNVINVSDLNTTGSSHYRSDKENGRPLGWIPMLREEGHTIEDAVTVVSRLQKGEETLMSVDVQPHYFVAIDQAFLEANSEQPDTVVQYIHDQRTWTEDQLLKPDGLDIIVPYFEKGNKKKFDRAKKFTYNYFSFFRDNELIDVLNSKVKEMHGYDLGGLLK